MRDIVNRFQNVDFVRAYKVLSLRAMGIVRRYGGSDTFDGGFDYEDVLGEVFKEFFDSPDGLGWKESKGSIEAFLGRVLHNKIVDHLRRQKHVGGSLDDTSQAAVSLSKSGPRVEAPEHAKDDFTAKLYALVGDDTPLRDLIAAAEMTSGSHNVNQELGELLDKTPHQVSKLKERLLKKEGVKELYAARQAAKTRA
jgi:DNA-directed RNA polymerase specialized sigma24 family protein